MEGGSLLKTQTDWVAGHFFFFFSLSLRAGVYDVAIENSRNLQYKI